MIVLPFEVQFIEYKQLSDSFRNEPLCHKYNCICLISNFTSYINVMSFNVLQNTSYTATTLLSNKVMKMIIASFGLSFLRQMSSVLVVELYEKLFKTIPVVAVCLCFFLLLVVVVVAVSVVIMIIFLVDLKTVCYWDVLFQLLKKLLKFQLGDAIRCRSN